MTSLINVNGFKEAVPNIYKDGNWTPAIAWVFQGGLWRRTFDPGFVNLLNNSRLLNGTDISVNQGKVTGITPVDWTLSSIPNGNSYSYSSFTQKEQVKSYRFVSEQSRHYYVARFQVTAGESYIVSADVTEIAIKNDLKALGVEGETAAIEIDVDFPSTRNLVIGTNSIYFTARTSGIVQFKMGAGVDSRGDADITIKQPQVSKGLFPIDWQPTPIIAPFYGVRLINSYLYTDVISYPDGDEYNFDSTLRIENDLPKSVLLFGRTDSTGFSGVGFNKTEFYVYRNGQIDRRATLSKPVILNRLVGIKVIWKKSGNYINDIRLYQNGELIARIPTSIYSGNMNVFFGHDLSRTNNITIQSLSMSVGRVYAFNVDEATGNVLRDRNKLIALTIAGTSPSYFAWIEDKSAPIITTDVKSQVASIGEEARFFADAIFYSSVQWYKDDLPLANETNTELKFTVTQESYGIYHAEFRNEFDKTETSRVELRTPEDKTKIVTNEDFVSVDTEKSQLIKTEGV